MPCYHMPFITNAICNVVKCHLLHIIYLSIILIKKIDFKIKLIAIGNN